MVQTDDTDAFVKLGAAIINQAIEDLGNSDPRIRLAAARYLFCSDGSEDKKWPTSFGGICHATGADPESVAKKVWDELPQKVRTTIKHDLDHFIKVTSNVDTQRANDLH